MGSMAELYQNYDGLQEFCKPPNKLQTRSTFVTSSPRWLITLMAILPFLGLSKERLVSLLRVALGRASHRDTKTRRQETSRRGFALWERRGPPRPLCSAPLATSPRLTRSTPCHGDHLRGRPPAGKASHGDTQDTEKNSRPDRRRHRRHQQFSAMTLPQLRETQCVKMRGQFVLLPDSNA